MKNQWGWKYTISIYVEGDRAPNEASKIMENINVPEDYDFVGMRIEAVQEKPVDQIAT